MASIFTWLKDFKQIWLRERIPNDLQLLSSIQEKIVELENLISSQTHIEEEEFNRAKLLDDCSSESENETRMNRRSSSKFQPPIENSLPTPPETVQLIVGDDQQESQAKQLLLAHSDSEDSQNEIDQRPVILLKRLPSKEIEEYYPNVEKNQDKIDSTTSSASENESDDFRILTRLISPKKPSVLVNSSQKCSSSKKHPNDHDVIIHYDQNRLTTFESSELSTNEEEIIEKTPENDEKPEETIKPVKDITNQLDDIPRNSSDEDQTMETLVDEEQQPIATISSYNHLLLSDSTDSEQEIRKKKRLLRTSSSSSSRSNSESKPKRKIFKKRISIENSNSSQSSDQDLSNEESNQTDKNSKSENEISSSSSKKKNSNKKEKNKKRGRKNIRKIIDDKELDAQTKNAITAERERRMRIAENQQKYNSSLLDLSADSSITDGPSTEETNNQRLILEFDKTTNEPLIEVSPKLVKHLKQHQIDGIRFLWNNLFESLEATQKKKKLSNGCILAHCMGLGKTLQVISFLHTIIAHQDLTHVRTCLVLCPINAALNWTNEFDSWLKGVEPALDHYQLTTIKSNLRINYVSTWYNNGGVLVMGYEVYRRLANGFGIRNKNGKLETFRCLVDPGPDVIIADEGHILKNAQTALAKCLSKVRTSRRVVLTGTPLQNNLIEYYCMVSFIKPNLLGTQQEYINRFVNPIQNGQHRDSNDEDVRLMKRRACVLHELLTGFVDRKDYSLLRTYLPPKFEYIIKIRLSDLQWALYENYLKHQYRCGQSNSTLKRDFHSAKLFADYQFLQKIWTHPFLLYPHFIDRWKKKLGKDDENLIDENEIEELFDEIDENKTKKKQFSGFLIENVDVESERRRRHRSTSSSSTVTIDSHDDEVQIVRNYSTRQRTSLNEEKIVTNVENDEPWLDEMRQQYWFPFLNALPPTSRFDVELSGKFLVLKAILEKTSQIGDKILLFSRSLFTLDHIEEFLKCLHQQNGNNETNNSASTSVEWIRDRDYFRMDGQTDVTTRKRYAKAFNDLENDRARLFLISTLAGGIGINLTGSNRVIIFDASWNPSHDTQAIFRSYRFGQKKPVYVYRFLAHGTMEEKIYQRQVVKQSLSQRVIDDHQLDRHFTQNDIKELYKFEAEKLPESQSISSLIAANNGNFPYAIPKDHLLLDLLYEHHRWIHSYHSHDSLLENRLDEGLTADERRRALEEYENLKKVPENRYLVLQRLQQQQQMNEMIARRHVHQILSQVLPSMSAGDPNRRPILPRSMLTSTSIQTATTDGNFQPLICLESDDESTSH